MDSPSPGWDVHTASARGASHLRSGAPNQDATSAYRSPDGTLAVACVADGHGSKRSFRSDIGANLAVEIGAAEMRGLLERVVHEGSPPHDGMKLLPATILSAWQRRVAEHAERHPFRPSELEPVALSEPLSAEQLAVAYGSTLLMVGVTATFGIFSQLGDGDIVWHHAGSISRPLGPPERQYGSETLSLANGRFAVEHWRTELKQWQQPPELVMLSTDGYANSYPDDNAFLRVVEQIHVQLIEHGTSRVTDHLPGWLRAVSSDGSGDDISVALLIGDARMGAASPTPTTPPAASPPPRLGMLAATGLLAIGALGGWVAGAAGLGPDLPGTGTPTPSPEVSPSPATQSTPPATLAPATGTDSPAPPGPPTASP